MKDLLQMRLLQLLGFYELVYLECVYKEHSVSFTNGLCTSKSKGRSWLRG